MHSTNGSAAQPARLPTPQRPPSPLIMPPGTNSEFVFCTPHGDSDTAHIQGH